MTLPKIAIGIPYYRTIEGPTLLACMSMAMRTAAVFTKISTDDDKAGMLPIGTSGCYIEDNRNGTVEYALQTGIPFTHLLWIDGDMTFPEDAVLRLLSHDKDIVGANYRTRTPPYACAGIYENGDTDTMAPGLRPMVQMPTGLLLTKFDIYRELPYPWFKPGMRGEARDDIYFCHYAKSRGYKIWCDNDLSREVTHIGVQQISWFQPDQIKTVVSGSQLNLERGAEEAKERAALSYEVYRGQNTAEAPGPGPDRPV